MCNKHLRFDDMHDGETSETSAKCIEYVGTTSTVLHRAESRERERERREHKCGKQKR